MQQAAVRELKEETGYSGRVVGATGQGYLSPGLTSESMMIVFAEVGHTARHVY